MTASPIGTDVASRTPGPDHDARHRADAEDDRAHALADAGGLDGRQADDLAGQGSLERRRPGASTRSATPDPRPWAARITARSSTYSADAPRGRQHHEQATSTSDQRAIAAAVAGGDRPVDHDADDDRDGTSRDLVDGDQPAAATTPGVAATAGPGGGPDAS